jgi:hypothetical protein
MIIDSSTSIDLVLHTISVHEWRLMVMPPGTRGGGRCCIPFDRMTGCCILHFR